MRRVILFLCVADVLSASAITLHRSFTHRNVGFGSGTMSVSVPIDRRAAQALDEGRAAARARELARQNDRIRARKKRHDARVLVIGEGTNDVQRAVMKTKTTVTERANGGARRRIMR